MLLDLGFQGEDLVDASQELKAMNVASYPHK